MPLVTLLVVALSACGSDDPPSGGSSSAGPSSSAAPSTVSAVSQTPLPATSTPSSTAASPDASAAATSSVTAATKPVTTPSTAAAAPPPRTAPPGQTLLVLEPDGVGLLRGTTARHFPFGSEVSNVALALSATLGNPSRTTQGACGQGARVQLDVRGFSALFNGSRFVGWVDNGQTKPPLTTMNGIGVGTTLGTLQARNPGLEVTDGTLGPEWTLPVRKGGAATFGGLLAGTSATSRITMLYAGETCFSR